MGRIQGLSRGNWKINFTSIQILRLFAGLNQINYILYNHTNTHSDVTAESGTVNANNNAVMETI